MSQACLSPETLQRLLDDQLADAERGAAGSHFNNCFACQAAAQAMLAKQAQSVLGGVAALVGSEVLALPKRDAEPRKAAPTELFDSAAERLESVESSGASASFSDGSAPTVIGPYRLLEKIGQGGFGIVYRAAQHAPLHRLVALKVIIPGMDNREILARFDAERQALALMDHPHIARVLDAGATADGRPYFVMELVEGLPLTEYCDVRRLTIRRRLELFVDVCQAVQHAHQKGIIHRDLKPSNVLVVERDGIDDVKVIDFGIAKALSLAQADGTAMTVTGEMIGTPLYMSPEQVSAASDVDTRADVYSLGAMLYELLAGGTPFERDVMKQLSLWEVLRLVREVEPARPSDRVAALAGRSELIAAPRSIAPRELVRQLRTDLDWIVLKALDKDRERRYPSAGALAADIERALHNEPVEASPPSQSYRWKKFARRNSLALTAAAVVFVSLTIGIGIALWQAFVALAAKQDVVTQFNVAQDLNYALEIRLASERLDQGDHEQARMLLDRWIPSAGDIDRRGIEWWLLTRDRRQLGDELLQLSSPLGADGTPVTRDVSCVRLSPDGSYVVAATDGGVIRRYSLKTESELPAWETRLFDVRRLAFSPDGRSLAAISYEAEAVVVDTATGQIRHAIPKPEGAKGQPVVEFFDNATLLVSGRGPVMQVWDADHGELRKEWCADCDYVKDFAVYREPAGIALLASDGLLCYDHWSASQPAVRLQGFVGTALSASHDGRYLAVGTYQGEVEVWDRRFEKRLAETLLSERVTELTFSADDQRLAIAEQTGMVHLWRWQHPDEPELEYRGPIVAAAVGADGALEIQTSDETTLSIPTDFPVNEHTDNDQYVGPQALARDAEGNLVIAWTQRSKDSDVYARRFDADGTPDGTEFLVNVGHAKNPQRFAAVARNSLGDFVTTWSDKSSGGEDVYVQFYNISGVPRGVPLLVNIQNAQGNQLFSRVALDGRGGYVVAWEDDRNPLEFGIYAKRFGPGGEPQGSEWLVNSDFERSYNTRAALAGHEAGNFVIAWRMERDARSEIVLKCFDSHGAPRSPGVIVNTVPQAWRCVEPHVAMNREGASIVVWTSADQDGSGWGVFARRFDATGTPLGPEFVVPAETAADQRDPAVAINDRGEFFIAWLSQTPATGEYSLLGRRFDANGTPEEIQFIATGVTQHKEFAPSVTLDNQGNFAACWTAAGRDGSGLGVYATSSIRTSARLQLLRQAIASQSAVHVVKDQRGRTIVEDIATVANNVREAAPGLLTGRQRPALTHFQAHPRPARSVVFTPDQQHIITAGIDGRIMRWACERTADSRLPKQLLAQTWIPGSPFVAVATSEGVTLRHPRTGTIAASLPLSPGTAVGGLACSDDGQWLAGHRERGAVVAWRVSGDRKLVELPGTTETDMWSRYFQFLPGSHRIVAIADQRPVHAWDVESGSIISPPDLSSLNWRSLGLSPRQPVAYLVTNDALWTCDLLTGERRRIGQIDGSRMGDVAVSPDGKLLAISSGRLIQLVDSETGEIQSGPLGHSSAIGHIEFSRDGRTLVAIDHQGALKFWQIPNGNELLTWRPRDNLYDFRLSPDGKWLSLTNVGRDIELLEVMP